MKKVTKKELRKTALKLLPAIYDSAMRTGAEDGLFQHEDGRTGLCLDAFLLAEAFEKAANYCDAEPEPQLKQLDQSVFNGLDEKWKSAATNTDGKAYLHNMPKSMMYFNHSSYGWCSKDYDAHEMQLIGDGFDPSGFAIGFIERDIAKELLEVDLSSELTGSDLCKAMLARGDKWVLCLVANNPKNMDLEQEPDVVISHDENGFYIRDSYYGCAMPINHKGEPLTAAEAGF